MSESLLDNLENSAAVSTDSDIPNTALLQVKNTRLSVLSLQVAATVIDDLKPLLEAKITQAPQLFNNASVVLNYHQSNPSVRQLQALVELCHQCGLKPILIQLDSSCSISEVSGIPVESNQPSQAAPVAIPKSEPKLESQSQPPIPSNSVCLINKPPLIVTKPVRSGQRIYAKASNLIVMATVNEGAEVIADGDIHVYGTLRGRAIAGASGCETATIVCQQLQAELVSIGGVYQLDEQAQFQSNTGTTAITLDGAKLLFTALA